MTATLQGTTQTQNTNQTSITGTEPTSTVDGDLLIANLGIASGDGGWAQADISEPTGWIDLSYEQFSTGTLAVSSSYVTRSGLVTLTWSTGTMDQVTLHISRIDGHQGIPLAVVGSNGNTSPWTPSNVTGLTSDGYLIVAVGAADSGVSFTGAIPTGYTQAGTEEKYTSQVTGFIMAGHFNSITAEQPGTVALGSDTPWACLAFAVRDAAGGLAPIDAAHGQSADAATFAQTHVLAPAGASHGQTSDAATFAQTHVLTAQDASQGHTADAATTAQTHVLAVGDATQGHAADGATFSQLHVLSALGATHGHAADAASVSQTHVLAVQQANHGHSADLTNISLGDHTVAPVDTAHGQAADAATFAQIHVLAPAGASHGQATDAATFTQTHVLASTDASHSHTADAVSFDAAFAALAATHGHLAAVVALTQIHIVAPAGADHSQTADAATFSQFHVLAAGQADHAHTSDVATLTSITPTPSDQRNVTLDVTPKRTASFDVTGRNITL